MKRAFLSLPALVAAVLGFSTFASARPLFLPAALSTFDGHSWSGLVIGQTIFKDIRPRFETGSGAYQHSTELTQPKNSGVRIDCLWTKRGNDEILSAITLRYRGVTPSSQQLENAFDPGAKEGQALYLRGRFEDWRIVRFPAKGVAAFQLRDGGDSYKTPLIVLSTPESLDRLSQPLLSDQTDVEERVDPMANAPKIGEFGEITVDYNGKEADAVPDWVRTNLKNDLHEVSAGGTLRWSRGAPGYYRLKVSASRSKKEDSGTFSVSAEVQADGPYGTITETASGSQRWDHDDNDYPPTPAIAFDKAVKEARRDVEAKYQRDMVSSGPPSLEYIHEAQWTELVTLLRADPTTLQNDATPNTPIPGF